MIISVIIWIIINFCYNKVFELDEAELFAGISGFVFFFVGIIEFSMYMKLLGV